jgi:hypothetical protein
MPGKPLREHYPYQNWDDRPGKDYLATKMDLHFTGGSSVDAALARSEPSEATEDDSRPSDVFGAFLMPKNADGANRRPASSRG